MRLSISLALVFGLLVASASAQQEPYNPYAPVVDDKPAVAADGKLHWPSFFKSADLQMRFQSLLAVDACQGTNKSITNPVINNRISIDAMPEGTAAGRVVGVSKGTLDILDESNQKRTIVLHPKGVSRVTLTGDVLAASLRPGQIVRFLGSVNEKGESIDRIDKFDVITLDEKFEPKAVLPNKLTSITAQVVSIRRQLLQVKVGDGSLSRLKIILADNAVAHLDVKDAALAAVGDKLSAKGHVYTNTASKVTERLVFASDVTIEKPALTGDDKSPSASGAKVASQSR